MVGRIFERKNTDAAIASFVQSIISIALTIVLVIITIGAVGIDTTSIAALLAGGGMAIGLALNGTVQNFAGGLMIIAFKPFKAGDYIQAQGFEGTVKLYAKWEEAKLENAYISFYGDSITTYKGMIPEGFANYYPAVDVQSVEDTWWHQVVSKTNSKLLMNNSYGGTAVYGGTNQGIDVNRMKLLATSEIKAPDVIIIFFGINDVVNGRTTTLFESSYTTMVEGIQKMYPNAILFLCTLSYETYTNSSTPGLRDAFSEIITKIGMKKNLPIIDFKNALSEKEAGKSLGDRIHPNKSGMKLLADEAINVVTEYFDNIKEYEINYNLDGGTFGNIVPKANYKGLNYSYTLPIPVKAGYKFLGWYARRNSTDYWRFTKNSF